MGANHKRDIRWAAGLFEGEGSISTIVLNESRGRPIRYIQLSLASTDEDTVREFARVVGGVVGGPHGGTPPRQQYYRWRVPCSQSKTVLRRLQPYLMGRRSQRAAEALSTKTGRIDS